MNRHLRHWAPWLLLAIMAAGLFYQNAELKASRSREAIYAQRQQSAYEHLLIQTDFIPFAEALERLSIATDYDEIMALFFEAEELATQFYDHLVQLNQLHYAPVYPDHHGVREYAVDTERQEDLFVPLHRSRFSTLLYFTRIRYNGYPPYGVQNTDSWLEVAEIVREIDALLKAQGQLALRFKHYSLEQRQAAERLDDLMPYLQRLSEIRNHVNHNIVCPPQLHQWCGGGQ